MSDVSATVVLPPDPIDEQKTWGTVTATPGFATSTAAPGTELDSPTVAAPTAPSITIDTSGTAHVVVPLTKKTKAIIGTIAAGVALALSDFGAYAPDSIKPYVLGVAGVGGLLATFMGISIPTNLPIPANKLK